MLHFQSYWINTSRAEQQNIVSMVLQQKHADHKVLKNVTQILSSNYKMKHSKQMCILFTNKFWSNIKNTT